jgi:hypothetical protein
MILYFDSFITDTPLNKTFVDPNKWVRDTSGAYAMPNKVDIAKYSLASYATYPWSHVLIRFELEDQSRVEEFENYARSLFPDAIIMRSRSANQAEYRKSLAILNEWDDDWIWYAPNNDHPIITSDLPIIDTVLAKAKSFSTDHAYVSVMYSHFSEFINIMRPGNPFWKQFGQDTTIIDEDENTITYVQTNGENAGIQIVNKNLFTYWFDGMEMGDARVVRSEDVRKFHKTPDQLIVMPKREIAAHFDGYSHTVRGLAEIAADQVPPLIIPTGFFDNQIKIRYGFSDYDPAYTNINPTARKYSFEDRHIGTDLKMTREQFPIFWKQRIAEVRENPDLTIEAVNEAATANFAQISNPYSLRHKKYNLQTIKYLLRHLRQAFRPL